MARLCTTKNVARRSCRQRLVPIVTKETAGAAIAKLPPNRPAASGLHLARQNPLAIRRVNIRPQERGAAVAVYHLHLKIISRSDGRSAVAAAAYRAGEKITNEYDGMEHDYTRKRGVIHKEIMLPANAPPEYADRAVLWNAVEKIEKAKNAQLAREAEIALPAELTKEQNLSLIRDYVKRHFVDQGMCADIAIHDTGKGKGQTSIGKQ